MTAGITLTDAITALVAEKRPVGCKYHAEQQVLARFEAFSRGQFPGLDTLTEASVQAWIVAARQRDVKPDMHLYDGGVPLPYIRDILGHVDLSTTEIYARASTGPNAKPSKPSTPASSLPTWPNGTKIPSCSAGSPASNRPDYAQRPVVDTAPASGNPRALRITQRCS